MAPLEPGAWQDAAKPELAALGADERFHRAFVLGRRLGAGAFGRVYSAQEVASGHIVAVKVVDAHARDPEGRRVDRIDARRQRAVEREVGILRLLPQDRNIVAFHGFHFGEGLAYLVMQSCSMGLLPLLDGMPVKTEAALKAVFEDMLSGIAACHAARIAHRDVKCDNFLVDAQGAFAVKLCDFGLASTVSSAEAKDLSGVCGTPPYMAPEMLGGESYSAKVDVWALGVLAYVLLFGAWPYAPPTLTSAAMKEAIRRGAPPNFGGRSSECAEWVQSLLCREPAERLSAAEALRGCSLKPWCSSAPLDQALAAAVRSGAFEQQAGHSTGVGRGLDEVVLRMNARCRGISEASTGAASDAPAPARL